MNQKIHGQHEVDAEGNPAGGRTTGTGIDITWQSGPLGRHVEGCAQDPAPGMEHRSVCAAGCTRRDPNGAFVEGVIAAAKDRLEHYQAGKFACAENQEALEYLDAALEALGSRTSRREGAGVEGTHAEEAKADGSGEGEAAPAPKGRSRGRR
jgi:hypothetical protein